MGDVEFRLLLVGLALVIAAAAVAIRLYVLRRPRRRMKATGLGPGIYLFTSKSCLDCAPVRERLAERTDFREIAWEDQPEVFERLGVEMVPATLVVEEDDSGWLWHGEPPEMISARNP